MADAPPAPLPSGSSALPPSSVPAVVDALTTMLPSQGATATESRNANKGGQSPPPPQQQAAIQQAQQQQLQRQAQQHAQQQAEQELEARARQQLAASAAAWAPPGVSAAAPAPSLRVAVSPTLAVLNLSNVTLAFLAADRGAGAAPQVVPPGAGPTPVTRGHALRLRPKAEGRRGGEETEPPDAVALAFDSRGEVELAK